MVLQEKGPATHSGDAPEADRFVIAAVDDVMIAHHQDQFDFLHGLETSQHTVPAAVARAVEKVAENDDTSGIMCANQLPETVQVALGVIGRDRDPVLLKRFRFAEVGIGQDKCGDDGIAIGGVIVRFCGIFSGIGFMLIAVIYLSNGAVVGCAAVTAIVTAQVIVAAGRLRKKQCPLARHEDRDAVERYPPSTRFIFFIFRNDCHGFQ